MMTPARVSLLLILLSAGPAGAQPFAEEYERILLPIRPTVVTGAFGSSWRTEATVTNHGNTPVSVLGADSGCGVMGCPQPPLPPDATMLISSMLGCGEVRGTYLSVERDRLSDLTIQLRTRDMSRQHETWGTTIPTVGKEQAFRSTFGLTDIPNEAQFRSTLRIYDLDAATPGIVRVRVFGIMFPDTVPRAPRPNTLLMEQIVTLQVPVTGGGARACPGFAEISLSQHSAFEGADLLRVEIEPLTPEKDYWAMASVTHNETQHVTVITPR